MVECVMHFCERQYSQKDDLALHIPQATRAQQLTFRWESITHEEPSIVLLSPVTVTDIFFRNSTYTVDRKSLVNLQRTLVYLLNSSMIDRVHINFQTSIILYSRNNIGEAMNSMATSMTDNIRTNAKSAKVQGKAFRTETFILVRWTWITLPVATVVLSILFLRQRESQIIDSIWCYGNRLSSHCFGVELRPFQNMTLGLCKMQVRWNRYPRKSRLR
ncbi:hypothetical protein BDV59DRAFT_177553 [Aspergillus ambiguus]|uniref:uncharacterized protein n=1 Tax=Aspergillus ambiguus TaxID=176160 RepID=UPI003CCD3076